jgi:hypothetical protein
MDNASCRDIFWCLEPASVFDDSIVTSRLAVSMGGTAIVNEIEQRKREGFSRRSRAEREGGVLVEDDPVIERVQQQTLADLRGRAEEILYSSLDPYMDRAMPAHLPLFHDRREIPPRRSVDDRILGVTYAEMDLDQVALHEDIPESRVRLLRRAAGYPDVCFALPEDRTPPDDSTWEATSNPDSTAAAVTLQVRLRLPSKRADPPKTPPLRVPTRTFRQWRDNARLAQVDRWRDQMGVGPDTLSQAGGEFLRMHGFTKNGREPQRVIPSQEGALKARNPELARSRFGEEAQEHGVTVARLTAVVRRGRPRASDRAVRETLGQVICTLRAEGIDAADLATATGLSRRTIERFTPRAKARMRPAEPKVEIEPTYVPTHAEALERRYPDVTSAVRGELLGTPGLFGDPERPDPAES